MKKFGILLLSLCITTSALADFWTNCTNFGGTIVTANSYGNDKGGLCNDPNDPNLPNNCNGKRFCKSGKQMNWWSSFTWCEAIGGKMASFASMCPNTQAASNSGKYCANIRSLVSHVWIDMGWSRERALAIWAAEGQIGDELKNLGNSKAPLCEE